MGTFIQVGFATLSALSLQPLMCYQHPNGLYSVLKYPSTFCGHSEQVIMIAIGMVLWLHMLLCRFARQKTENHVKGSPTRIILTILVWFLKQSHLVILQAPEIH